MAISNSISTLQSAIGSLAVSGSQQAGKTPDSTQVAAGGGKADGRLDQTSLSSESGLVALAAASPDVRLDKVAALQQAISNGSYHVAASAVADKIVEGLLTGR